MLTYLWKLTHKQRKSADRLSSIWKGILTQSFIARNWIIRDLQQIQLVLQEERLKLCWLRLWDDIEGLLFINVTVYLPLSFRKKKYPKKAKYSIYGNILPVFLHRRFPFLGETKHPTPVLLSIHFFSGNEGLNENRCTW